MGDFLSVELIVRRRRRLGHDPIQVGNLVRLDRVVPHLRPLPPYSSGNKHSALGRFPAPAQVRVGTPVPARSRVPVRGLAHSGLCDCRTQLAPGI